MDAGHPVIDADPVAPGTRHRRLPPGPPGHFLLGNLPDFARDILAFHEMCRDQYGDIVRLKLGTRVVYVLNHPDLIHEVLVGNHRNFIKHSFFWRHVTAIFGKACSPTKVTPGCASAG